MAFEGFRYWDLRRWRLAGEVIDGKQAHGTK
ncbi:RagB/SusD family nutrient uptake outer membrane protein [Bacteroides ovatus]|nr:RagB/SusD family nutrient uptake outer membrane protein [Bacteroides ovatus]